MIDTGTKRPENKPAAAAKAKPVESEKADDANKDLERGLNGNSKSAATGGGTPARSSDFGMHDLFRENMNYTSIDRGSHCTEPVPIHHLPAG